MSGLLDDERMMLKVLATLAPRFGLYDMLDAVLPPKPIGLRLGGRKRWALQWEATMRTWDALKTAGLVRIVGTSADSRANLFEITSAGREALDGAKEAT